MTDWLHDNRDPTGARHRLFSVRMCIHYTYASVRPPAAHNGRIRSRAIANTHLIGGVRQQDRTEMLFVPGTLPSELLNYE